jgi:DNA-binding SARP family transcriptional activator
MRVEVFGSLRVRRPAGDLQARDFRGAKPKQILEILVLERGHTVSKARLADLLWGESLPQNHQATLETYVSGLRQALEPGIRPRDSAVLTERGGYRLDLARVRVDLDDFDLALQEAAHAEPQPALEALKRALPLVRGQVLEDEPYADWARQVRDTYEQRYVQALIDAARLSLLTGDAPDAMALAERAVALSPLAEPAYQVLMTAAYSLWRQDEALAAFERCRRLLAEELGADPLDETVALHLSILRHEDVAQLLPTVRAASPQPAAGGVLPLLARDRELQQLREAAHRAASGHYSIAVVTGADGLGKTRLVEALAESVELPLGLNRCSDLERGFPYLALSLALRPVLSDVAPQGLPLLDSVLAQVEQVTRFDEIARLRAMESLAATLRGHPPFLLVLDDVQWADPESITLLDYLQRRTPDAPVLVVLTCDRSAITSGPLRRLRPDLRIDLRELPREAVESLGGAELYQATGGNPLHMAGWLEARSRGLPGPITPELRERLLTACWDLGPQAYRLLLVAAAVEDGQLTGGRLSQLLDARAEDVAELLDGLVQQGLLDATGEGWSFHAPMVREVLRAMVSPARRRLLQGTTTRATAGDRAMASTGRGRSIKLALPSVAGSADALTAEQPAVVDSATSA